MLLLVSNKMDNKNGWNKRCVDFSKVHGNDDEAFASLLSDIKLRKGMKIGDIMGGYGGVSAKILEQARNEGLALDVFLSDAFETQIKRSIDFLREYESENLKVTRKVEDIRVSSLPSNHLDALIIKMGLHELPYEEQLKALSESYRILKPGSRIYIWAPLTQTRHSTPYYREIIRKKDELAGYSQLVQNRYFSSKEELLELMKSAGFEGLQQVHLSELGFELSTKKFCEADMVGDQNKLREFNEYMRSLPENVKAEFNFKDDGDDIKFSVNKEIISATKIGPYSNYLLDRHTRRQSSRRSFERPLQFLSWSLFKSIIANTGFDSSAS